MHVISQKKKKKKKKKKKTLPNEDWTNQPGVCRESSAPLIKCSDVEQVFGRERIAQSLN